jgi:pimeloyl-ACP methyl ester carboxylesterase
MSTLEKVRVGGADQWILERSENIDNPIVLFLHGGPGTSQLTLNRRNTRDLERFFTVVNWDQRGAGKSYPAIRNVQRMTIDQFVEDTRELTLYLLRTFDKARLVLVGHSWGTVVGALAVARYPELYSCYVGVGQTANMTDGERASYRWTLE